MDKVLELRQKWGEIIDSREKMVDEAEAADRDFDESEKAKWDEAGKRADELKERIERLEATNREQAEAAKPASRARPEQAAPSTEAPKRQGAADQVLDSEQYKRFLDANGSRLQAGVVRGIAHMEPVKLRAILTLGATSGGALTSPMDTGIISEYGRQTLTVLDLITRGQTDSDAVEFVRVTGETLGAAPVAEASAATGTSGLKPESTMALERVTEQVRTIAVWMAATTRVMADAGQLRTLIESQLRYDLALELEDQIVNGDGTGENFEGIATVNGVQAQAWDTNILKTTRVARRKVRTVGRATPTGYLLNPIDWEVIDLLQDNEARYYFGGPRTVGTPMLWGLPVVESEAVVQGTGYVGDFKRAVLWDRQQASIATGTIDDDFVRNIIRVLAEMRAAFGVLKPNAFVEMDLTA